MAVFADYKSLAKQGFVQVRKPSGEYVKNTIAQEHAGSRTGGLFLRLSQEQQRKLFDAFLEFAQPNSGDTMLDVGLASSTRLMAQGYFSKWAEPPLRSRIGVHNIHPFTGIDGSGHALAQAEELPTAKLPFSDGEFDWVCCSGVIEHAGNPGQQFQVVRELARVAHKGVFLATPNRRHPVDFHSALPFVHWLPDAWRRRVLNWSGKNADSLEPRPNLLLAESLYRFAGMLPEKLEYEVGHKRVFGLKAHFFLMLSKNPATAGS